MAFHGKGSLQQDLGVYPQRVLGIDRFKGDIWFVDGDQGTEGSGKSWSSAYDTITKAVARAAAGDIILVAPLEAESASGDSDPDSYAETIDIPAGKDGLSIVGVSRGLTQGGQPQIRPGSGSTPLISIDAFGVLIQGLTLNGAGATGGGVLLNANSTTENAGGTVIQGCHLKNLKGSAAAASGGAIYCSSNGHSWYVAVFDCDFIDCRAGICMLGTGISIPQHWKIRGCNFFTDPNTDCDADIYVAADGILNLQIIDCNFGTVDVPAYASSPDAARYIKLANGTSGMIANCNFACVTDPAGTEKTFGAAGTGAIFPTTVRMVNCYGEGVAGTGDQALIGRT